MARSIALSTELKFVANRNSFLANLFDDGVYAPLDLIVSNKLRKATLMFIALDAESGSPGQSIFG